MLKKIATTVGQPGMVLVWGLVIGIGGSLGTILVSPMAAIPLVGLFALVLSPFPTLAVYSAGALASYLCLRAILFLLPLHRGAIQWIAAISAVGLVVAVGYALPNIWNSEAGLTASAPQARPAAVAIPKDGAIALINHGDPQYVRCGSLCFALLLQKKVASVIVASTLDEPSPFKNLPGKMFAMNDKTMSCLEGQPDYSFAADDEARHEHFIEFGLLPIEYETCLDSLDVILKPAKQTTIVEWKDGNKVADDSRVGFSGAVGLIRTIVPQGEHQQLVQQSRHYEGRRYDTPLFIWPYAGNEGFGTYFSPMIMTSYFEESGFPESSSLHWKLLIGSEDIARNAATQLDTVIKRDHR